MLVVVCGLLVAMTASHQLSPFAAIPILAALLLTGRSGCVPARPGRGLPVGWLVFAASAFFAGHLSQLFGSFGDIGANTSAR